MTPEEKKKLTEQLYRKSVGELIDLIINQQEELEESRMLRRRMIQIRNLVLSPEERRSPGRPRRGETDNLLFGGDRDKVTSIKNN